MVLPVTPDRFTISHGIKSETVSIHTLGDVVLPGLPALSPITVSCLFPYRSYPFAYSDGAYSEPYEYVEQLKKWTDSKTILRYVVSGTEINLPVFIETVQYGEQDGTNDVYATITLRMYQELAAVKTVTSPGTRSTADKAVKTSVSTYTAVRGDTMWAIARKFYGNPQLCWKLATYNGKKNANLLMVGEVLKIPPKEALA